MKKKRRPEKRRATDQEESRAADAKLKRFISSSAIELAKREPNVQRQMVAQTFGYHLPDEVEKMEGELHAYIDKLAIDKLKKDDGFAQEIAEARIRQVTEEMGLNLEGDESRRKPASIDDYIEQFRKIQELKEVIGVKEPGTWSSLLDPQVITSFLALAREIFAKEQPPAENKVLVLVQMDGIKRLVTTEEFKQMTGKEPVAYLDGEEPPGPDNEAKSNDPASEPETPDKTEAEDGETGATNLGG